MRIHGQNGETRLKPARKCAVGDEVSVTSA